MKSNVIAEFIPIIFLFTYLSYPNESFVFFNSSLGRLLFILIIIFYSALDKLLGLFVCGLVILFYQLDDFPFYDFQLDLDMEYLLTDKKFETFAKYETVEHLITTPSPSSPVEQAKSDFRNKYCENGILKYKNVNVNLQMVQHIFPEIEFNNIVCNPCKSDCKYSIIESKLKMEEEMRPVNTTP
uniref:Uncharacterized protein n=1 Tax=viral metagenome TaxID=1070528 RepID=A0A6C0DSE3_9ZZZZ